MKYIVYVAGASCSGKTTFAKELARKLAEMNIRAKVISMDNYYKAIPIVTGN